MKKWKEKCGASATYRNLIGVFEHAGYQNYADEIRHNILHEPKISGINIYILFCNNIQYTSALHTHFPLIGSGDVQRDLIQNDPNTLSPSFEVFNYIIIV